MGDCNQQGNYHQQPAAGTESKAIAKSALLFCASLALLAIGVPLWAQAPRVYRDGNSWVEEVKGTLPPARELHVFTDIGSVQVQGNSPRITYLIRKRSYAPTEELARRQFDQFRVTDGKTGETDAIQGKITSKQLARFGTEFIVQTPRDLSLVKVETRGGSLAFASIAATIVASTGAGLIKLDDLAGPVKIVSGGGNIEGGNLGNDFSVTSGAADVRVANVGGQTQVNLGGGRVYIGTTHASTIQTGAGSIQVQKCIGDLHVTSGGGIYTWETLRAPCRPRLRAEAFGWQAPRARCRSLRAVAASSSTSWAAAPRSRPAQGRSWSSLWAIVRLPIRRCTPPQET